MHTENQPVVGWLGGQCAMPRNRYHKDSSDPAKIRTISILGDVPPSASYTPKHARDAGGINHER